MPEAAGAPLAFRPLIHASACVAASSTQREGSALPQQVPGLVLVLVLVVAVVVVNVVEVVMHASHKTGQTDIIRSLTAKRFDSHKSLKPGSQSVGGSAMSLHLTAVAVDVVVLVRLVVVLVLDVDVEVVATHVPQRILHELRKAAPNEGWTHNILLLISPNTSVQAISST